MVNNCAHCRLRHITSQCPYRNGYNQLNIGSHINLQPDLLWRMLWICSNTVPPPFDKDLFNEWVEYFRINHTQHFMSVEDVNNVSLSFQDGIDNIHHVHNRSVFLTDVNSYNLFYNEWCKTVARLFSSRQNLLVYN